jgi:hypothetical protein
LSAAEKTGEDNSSELPALTTSEEVQDSSIDLYWLPLGAGGRFVRWNGRLFEAAIARREHRAVEDLYHCALEVRERGDRFVIEMGPVWNVDAADRGVVCEGPVGTRWLSRFGLFRYEVRLWRDGCIPDVAEAVDSPQRLSNDESRVAHLLEILPTVPSLTWGRDELRTGEMWNSNSLTSWLLARTGHDMTTIRLPARGRAPGWRAGLVLASRQGTPATAPAPGTAPAPAPSPAPPTP